MSRPWKLPALFALCGIVLATVMVVEGTRFPAVAVLLVFLLLAAANSPLLFPRGVTAEEAVRRAAADGGPIIYFRPGCQFCVRLRIVLGRRGGRAHWVNIWQDPAAAAAVRAVNDGNETVPTVVVDGRAHTNPDPSWVQAQIPTS